MINENKNKYVNTAIYYLRDAVISNRKHIDVLRTDILDLSPYTDTTYEEEHIEQQIDSLAFQQIKMHNALEQLLEFKEEARPKRKLTLDELIAQAPDA